MLGCMGCNHWEESHWFSGALHKFGRKHLQRKNLLASDLSRDMSEEGLMLFVLLSLLLPELH